MINYCKGSENTRVDTLSRRQDYAGRSTKRPRAILKNIGDSIIYNYKLLATILIVEDTELEQRIKNVYAKDECASRVLKELIVEFITNLQGLLRFKGLVYILSGIRKQFVREQYLLPAYRH
jgi:hypothetical protein